MKTLIKDFCYENEKTDYPLEENIFKLHIWQRISN